jgi:hypothetical protein
MYIHTYAAGSAQRDSVLCHDFTQRQCQRVVRGQAAGIKKYKSKKNKKSLCMQALLKTNANASASFLYFLFFFISFFYAACYGARRQRQCVVAQAQAAARLSR